MRKSLNFLRGFLVLLAFLLLSAPLYSQDTYLSLQKKGIGLMDKGKYKEAIVRFEEAAKNRRSQLGDNSEVLSLCLNNIGVCYRSLGDYSKALEYYQP